ncbi:diguanylate cyclase domain-containing protein [Lysobacter sp. A3-1-A15]|uniref:diguanylate cyclase domain-containing protein n=1 Tax=Novilysobacter viscosus TaxID=3098602 RepID=UPI002ED8FC8F
MKDDAAHAPDRGTTRELARLRQVADVMRAQLLKLQHELVQAHRDTEGDHAARLLEANTQLVQAALLAQTEAAAALEDLVVLSHSSQTDPLTGLPNRAVLLDRLRSAIALAHRHKTSLAVLFFDVDGLKYVNDTRGHQAGDETLQAVARQLRSLVRDCDTVCRYGGDEFVVLLLETTDAGDAVVVVEKIMAALAATLPGSHALSASAGVSLYPQHGEDAAALIQHADAAMYVAKRKGPGLYEVHGQGGDAFPAAPPVTEASPRQRESALRSSQRDLREANEQLVVAALQAQTHEADAREDHRRQIQYMAMVAHELRNPLAPIRSAASLLGAGGANTGPSLPRLRAIIERQVVQMSRLIEDLLEGSRVSSGKLRMECSDVDLADILELAVLTCRPGIQARDQSVTLEMGPSRMPLHGDPVRLVQVFCNLLDNASKYTQSGGRIAVVASSAEGGFAVSVRDNGVGISPLAITRIFDLFAQDDQAVALDSRGLGIGLAVVRDLIDSHGGSVTASSEGKGLGSEFVVTLPTRP